MRSTLLYQRGCCGARSLECAGVVESECCGARVSWRTRQRLDQDIGAQGVPTTTCGLYK
jgi:hypothetical protein